MFFTPFAFIQQPYAVTVVPASSQNYYIGGTFTTYTTATSPYFRELNNAGTITSSLNIGAGFNGLITTLVTQSDGKIVAGGGFSTYSGSSNLFLVKINTNGTKDTTFNVGAGLNSTVYGVATQPDNKTLVVGAFTTYSGSSKSRIVRVNTDGTADTGSSWNQGTGFSSQANTVTYDPVYSRIYAGGLFSSYSGSGATRIAAINTDGKIITGSIWNSGAGFNGTVNIVQAQSDGKIIAGGTFTLYSGSSKNWIARLNTDGTADTGSSWNQGTGFNNGVNTLKIQSNGKIVVGGDFTSYSGSTTNRIVRINTDGTQDTTFNVGTGFEATVTAVGIQPDGKITVIGQFTTYSGSLANGVVRLNTDGTRDNTFNTKAGINTTVGNQGAVIPLSSESTVIAAGFTGNKVGYLSYLNNSGSEASSNLVSSYGLNGNVNSIISQSDGKLIVGGAFNTYSGSVTQSFIARLNTDYTVDPTFNIGAGFNTSVVALVTQSNGKIIAGGAFSSYSGSFQFRIARLNTDGTLDTSFDIGGGTVGFNNTVNALVVQPDQKILVGGAFTTYSGSVKQGIVRLNPNGTADTGSSWNQGIGITTSTIVSTLARQLDGKILIGGTFTTYSGSGATRIARLNVSGTIDTGSTWNSGAGLNNGVNIIEIQSDQKILAGGVFTAYSGSGASRIARINTNGTIDTGSSWNSGTGFNAAVSAILPQSDNKIMIGGSFTTYSGSTANRIIRLNSNGTVDTTFTPTGSGYSNGQVSKIIQY